jgi:hypothetical protein
VGIAVDSAANAYVTGSTLSTTFPVTSGAFQRSLAGGTDAFVSKVTTSTTAGSGSTSPPPPGGGIQGGGSPPNGTPPGNRPQLAPRIGQLRIAPRTFYATSSHQPRNRRRGALVSFTLNEAARIRFTVEELASGREILLTKTTGRCVAQTQRNRSLKRCTRRVPLPGSIAKAASTGTNRFRFSGRITGRTLAPGNYVLVAIPSANGRRGRAASIKFTIKRS